jgi:hypothetical protein
MKDKLLKLPEEQDLRDSVNRLFAVVSHIIVLYMCV